MICEHCGTEHALGADYVCRDVLKTQLAIETKRAEEALAEIERLRPYLRHHYGCVQANTHPGYCTCGLLIAARKDP